MRTKLLLSVALISTSTYAQNVVPNHSFETGDLTSWSLSTDGPSDTSGVYASGSFDTTAEDGSYFFAFGNPNNTPPFFSGNGLLSDGGTALLSVTFATTPGTDYSFSFWGAGNPILGRGNNGNINVFWGAETFAEDGFVNSYNDLPGWSQQSFTTTLYGVPLEATGDATTVYFLSYDGPGEFLDNIDVQPVGGQTPGGGSTSGTVPDGGATVSMLAGALIGLATLRRRFAT
jgi:VPDSG-CTERM motif